MSDTSNPAYQGIKHLNHKYDAIGDDLKDFMARQAAGETPDPEEFSKLLELQSVTKSALTAQYNLLQKPVKIVLNEAKM